MTTVPKSAIAINSTVIIRSEDDTEFTEVCCNKNATRFWVWTGAYFRRYRGEERRVDTAREIDREEAIRLTEWMDEVNAANDKARAEALAAEENEPEVEEEVEDDRQMTLAI